MRVCFRIFILSFPIFYFLSRLRDRVGRTELHRWSQSACQLQKIISVKSLSCGSRKGLREDEEEEKKRKRKGQREEVDRGREREWEEETFFVADRGKRGDLNVSRICDGRARNDRNRSRRLHLHSDPDAIRRWRFLCRVDPFRRIKRRSIILHSVWLAALVATRANVGGKCCGNSVLSLSLFLSSLLRTLYVQRFHEVWYIN